MKNERALIRVRQDLASGRHGSAVRRLRAMLAADPSDASAYRLLTEVYRQLGNPEEAGRWGYLTGDATAEEVAAFERAHPQPWVRLRLLGKDVDPRRLPSDAARDRMVELRQQAAEVTVPIQRGRVRAPGAEPGAIARSPMRRGKPDSKIQMVIPAQRRPAPLRAPAPHPAAAAPQPVRAMPRIARAANVRGIAGLRAAAGRLGRRTRYLAGERRLSRTRSIRNYLVLGMLIIMGGLGSLVTVAAIRAMFGIRNGFAPIEAIFAAIGRLFGF